MIYQGNIQFLKRCQAGLPCSMLVNTSYNCFINLRVTLFYTPPNSTQLLHPLDVGVFRPLKYKFKSLCKLCTTANLSGSALDNRANFPGTWHLAIQNSVFCMCSVVQELEFDSLAIDRSCLKKSANVHG